MGKRTKKRMNRMALAQVAFIDLNNDEEIPEEDNEKLLTALNSGCLVMITREDLKKINEGDQGNGE